MNRRIYALGLVVAMVAMQVGAGMACAADESTLDVVKKRGTLVAGVKYDLEPFGYMGKDGKVEGFDVDVARYIAKKLGVGIEAKQVTSQNRIPLLLNGNIDLIVATMNPTRERAKVVDFTRPYFMSGTMLLVKKGGPIKSVADMENRTLGVPHGATERETFLALQPKGKVSLFNEWPQAVLALKNGRVDGVMNEGVLLTKFVKENPELQILDKVYKPAPYAIAVRQNDSKWRQFIEEALMDMWMDGTYAEITKRHTGQEPTWDMAVWPDYYDELNRKKAQAVK
jgi:polar amino acid transport system substrate-binding protein